MFKWLNQFKSLLYEDIIIRHKVIPFVIFAFFLLSFAAARIMAYYFSHHNHVAGYHIHHFFWGIAFLIISNWVALVGKGKHLMHICAAVFGMGLGMVMDEIGLMVICGTVGLECNPDKLYWARFSYDIIIYAVIAFLLILYFRPFWNVFRRRILGIFYKPFRAYRDVEKVVRKEIKKRHEAIKKEIKKRI